ncbi:MAG: NifU family protein [Bacilli bacterium]
MPEKDNKTNNEIIEQIKEIINSIRPYINMDGGDIEFIRYEDNYVFVKLTGACVDCGLIDMTINDSLANTLQSEIPEIKGVINIDI